MRNDDFELEFQTCAHHFVPYNQNFMNVQFFSYQKFDLLQNLIDFLSASKIIRLNWSGFSSAIVIQILLSITIIDTSKVGYSTRICCWGQSTHFLV